MCNTSSCLAVSLFIFSCMVVVISFPHIQDDTCNVMLANPCAPLGATKSLIMCHCSFITMFTLAHVYKHGSHATVPLLSNQCFVVAMRLIHPHATPCCRSHNHACLYDCPSIYTRNSLNCHILRPDLIMSVVRECNIIQYGCTHDMQLVD